jgi:hypothetical protein
MRRPGAAFSASEARAATAETESPALTVEGSVAVAAGGGGGVFAAKVGRCRLTPG